MAARGPGFPPALGPRSISQPMESERGLVFIALRLPFQIKPAEDQPASRPSKPHEVLCVFQHQWCRKRERGFCLYGPHQRATCLAGLFLEGEGQRFKEAVKAFCPVDGQYNYHVGANTASGTRMVCAAICITAGALCPCGSPGILLGLAAPMVGIPPRGLRTIVK